MRHIFKADLETNLGDRFLSIVEQVTGILDTQIGDKAGQGLPGLRFEIAAECSFAHVREVGGFFQ